MPANLRTSLARAIGAETAVPSSSSGSRIGEKARTYRGTSYTTFGTRKGLGLVFGYDVPSLKQRGGGFPSLASADAKARAAIDAQAAQGRQGTTEQDPFPGVREPAATLLLNASLKKGMSPGDATERTYRGVYPECPPKIDPGNPLHDSCKAEWLRLYAKAKKGPTKALPGSTPDEPREPPPTTPVEPVEPAPSKPAQAGEKVRDYKGVRYLVSLYQDGMVPKFRYRIPVLKFEAGGFGSLDATDKHARARIDAAKAGAAKKKKEKGDRIRYPSASEDRYSPSDAARRRNLEIIQAVFNAGGRDAPWQVPAAIALRESRFNQLAEHMHPADRAGALKAWQRLREELYSENPWKDDQARWDRGRGMFGMMPAYHLARTDPRADPLMLHNPFFVSLAAARLANAAVGKGAKNWGDVNLVWATGKLKPSAYDEETRRPRLRKRVASMGNDPRIVDAGIGPDLWGSKPRPDDYARLQAIAESMGIADWRNPYADLADKREGIKTGPVERPGKKVTPSRPVRPPVTPGPAAAEEEGPNYGWIAGVAIGGLVLVGGGALVAARYS